MFKVAFAGFRHGHIFTLYNWIKESDNAMITGGFEPDAAAREAAVERAGVDFVYDTYEQLLSDDSVDIVAIGDCYGKRGAEIIKALTAGKHVIADKPLCTSLEELYEIRRLAEQKNLKVSGMYDLRCTYSVNKAREIVSQGLLGEVHNVGFTGQHALDYGKRPSWYFEEGMHGGTINDIAIHGMDLVRMITGKELVKVHGARCWNAFAKEEKHFKDSAQFIVEMTGGMGVMADVSYAKPVCSYPINSIWRFSFWGEKGMLEFSMKDDKVFLALDKSEEPQIFEGTCNEPNPFEQFLLDINGTPTSHDTYSALKSAEAVLTIQKFADEHGG